MDTDVDSWGFLYYILLMPVTIQVALFIWLFIWLGLNFFINN